MKLMLWPLILILLGALFLLHNLGVLPLGALKQLLATWWPLILIAVGVAGRRFLHPCATPGGMRTKRELPSPSTVRITCPSVGDPLRTSARTSRSLSDGGTYHTSVCFACRWNALIASGSSTL